MNNVYQDETTGLMTLRHKMENGTYFTRHLRRITIKPDDFLKVAETLERIGIMAPKTKTLWQSCHILHKKGFYYICHFKEMFLLDGKEANFSVEDEDRRDYIIALLLKWNLIDIPSPALKKAYTALASKETESKIKLMIIPYSAKRNFNLCSKYQIGVSIPTKV